MKPNQGTERKTHSSNSVVVVFVRGSVVNIRFDAQLPPIHSLLRAGAEEQIVIEVLTQRDARHVRGIALTPTQGLARGMALAALPGKPQVWAIGERVHARLADAGLPPLGLFPVPNSVKAIAPLVGQILVASETRRGQAEVTELHLFYNRHALDAVYAPVSQRLLPLDDDWRRGLTGLP